MHTAAEMVRALLSSSLTYSTIPSLPSRSHSFCLPLSLPPLSTVSDLLIRGASEPAFMIHRPGVLHAGRSGARRSDGVVDGAVADGAEHAAAAPRIAVAQGRRSRNVLLVLDCMSYTHE